MVCDIVYSIKCIYFYIVLKENVCGIWTKLINTGRPRPSIIMQGWMMSQSPIWRTAQSIHAHQQIQDQP